jgi:hypothetical protein
MIRHVLLKVTDESAYDNLTDLLLQWESNGGIKSMEINDDTVGRNFADLVEYSMEWCDRRKAKESNNQEKPANRHKRTTAESGLST